MLQGKHFRQARHQMSAEGLMPAIIEKAAMQFRLAGKELCRQDRRALQIVDRIGPRIVVGQNLARFLGGQGVVRRHQNQSQRFGNRARITQNAAGEFRRPR